MKPLILCLFLFSVLSMRAQEILDNSTILELAEIGLDESIIINKINSSFNLFDVDVSDLKSLKKAGLSAGVINAMMSAANNPDLRYSDPLDPMSPHPGGFYFKTTGRFTELEYTSYSGGKSSGQILNRRTGGISSVKTKVVVGGKQSRQVFAGNPEFYFYSTVSENSAFSGFEVASPNSFVCVKLDVKSDSRELQLGSTNILGAKSGINVGQQVDFRFEELSNGIYIIWFDYELPPGEYAFMNTSNVSVYVTGNGASSNSENRAFDFSIAAL